MMFYYCLYRFPNIDKMNITIHPFVLKKSTGASIFDLFIAPKRPLG